MKSSSTAPAWSQDTMQAPQRVTGAAKPALMPLVEIPSQYVALTEAVMKALSIDGQRELKAELHVAVESSNPGLEIAYTNAAWAVSQILVADPSFLGDLEKLDQLAEESEDMTIDELARRVGLES